MADEENSPSLAGYHEELAKSFLLPLRPILGKLDLLCWGNAIGRDAEAAGNRNWLFKKDALGPGRREGPKSGSEVMGDFSLNFSPFPPLRSSAKWGARNRGIERLS